MKLSNAVLAIAVAVTPGFAHAATTGTLSGTYGIRYSTLCQAYNGSAGTISQSVGVIQFIPSSSGALSGTVNAAATQSVGSLVAPGSSPNITEYTDPSSTAGTFSLTLPSGTFAPGTITITLGTGQPITFTAYLGSLKSGVYDHADFINVDNLGSTGNNCTTSGAVELSSSSTQ